MKNKKQVFLTLPILISAVSICAATSSYASLYKAKTSWNVNSEANADYCSASQGYSDKAYLTFAKRVDGSISLAVDFQKNSFEKGKKYSFKIKVGDVVQSFKIEPSSNNAVVFPLGSDNRLIDALADNSILNLNVDGATHDFSIRDADKLSADLSACVTKMMPAQKVAEEVYEQKNTANVASAPVSNNMATGSVELANLKLENVRLSNLLKQVRRDSDSRISSITSNPYTEEAKEKVFLLEKENMSLKSSLASLSKLKTKLDDVKSVESKLNEEVKQKTSLQKELIVAKEELVFANKKLADLSKKGGIIPAITECADLPSAKLSKKSDNALNDQIAEQQREIDLLKSQNFELVKQVKDHNGVKSNNSSITSEYDALEKRYNTAIVDLESVKSQNTESKKELRVLENQLAGMIKSDNLSSKDAGWNLEKATQRYQEAQREIVSLGRMVEQGSAKCSAEKKDLEGLLFDPEIANTQQRIKLSSLDEEIKKKDSAISAANEERDIAVARLEENLNDATSSKNRVIAALEMKNGELQGDIADLMRDIAVIKQERNAIEAGAEANLRAGIGAALEMQQAGGDAGRNEAINNLQAEKNEIETELNSLLIALDDASKAEDALYAEDARYKEGKSRPDVIIENEIYETNDVVEIREATEQPMVKEVLVENKIPMDQPSAYLKDLVNTISVTGDLTEQRKNGMNIFRWKKDDLHGIAIEKPLARGVALSDGVNAYIDRAQSKCSGDFAAIPSLQSDNKQMYEIACVKSNGKGSSASLLFLKNDNDMITIAHEGRTDLMEQAINARDQISKTVRN